MKRVLIVLGCLLALSGCAGYPYSVSVGVGGGYYGGGDYYRYRPYYEPDYRGCYPMQVPIYNRFGQPIGYRTICR